MWLRVLTGDRAGRVVRVRGERFVVGQDEGCDLALNDPLVAEQHAAFERTQDGGYALVDLGSEGGTFVATRRLRGRVELEGEEELCFGETFARLSTRAPRARRAMPVTLAGLGLVLVFGAIALLATRVGGSPEAVSEAPAGTEVATEVVTEFESVTVTVGPEGATEAAPTEPPPATEPAPEEATPVSFADDFSDPGTGWEVFANAAATAGYENGEYVMRILDSAFYATADSGRRVDDAVVHVTARNPARTTNAGFGVICRYRGADDYFVLAIGADGSAAILRRENGELRVLTGGGAWLESPRVAVGAESYELLADCRGDRLRLSVDGARVVSTPASSPAGRVGLFAAGPAEIRFDDFAAEQSA
jgi:Inner membrane component of T3SS, cytoplasmic domain